MSLPRRAMSDMGMAICCLMCDAPDEAGSARCRSCISRHQSVRERIARGDDPVARFGKELLAMMANPERYDHDETHGEVLRGYVHLMNDHEGPRTPPTPEEIDTLFATARKREKGSLIRDMANRSQWKDKPPTPELARLMADDLPEDAVEHTGKRTIPSRPIEAVDRSERSGEDKALSDRITAAAAHQDAPEELQDVLIDADVHAKQAKRKRWKDARASLDDLLDD